MRQWIQTQRSLRGVIDELSGPQRLQTLLRTHGQAATAAEAANARIQTRWLLGLALLVAFVGILNAMLMSVTERFREIGTMKCLGALDSFIIKLFLIESLFQGLVGTALGVAGGLVLSLASAWSAYGAYAWKNVPWTTLGFDALQCLAVGIALTVAGALLPRLAGRPHAAYRCHARRSVEYVGVSLFSGGACPACPEFEFPDCVMTRGASPAAKWIRKCFMTRT